MCEKVGVGDNRPLKQKLPCEKVIVNESSSKMWGGGYIPHPPPQDFCPLTTNTV